MRMIHPKRAITRFKQKRRTKFAIGQPLGGGHAGRVYRATITRGKRERNFALKRYTFITTGVEGRLIEKKHGRLMQRRLAKKDLQKLGTLKKMGFPTIPFPVATKKGLLMKELSENGSKKVFDFSRAVEQFNRLHGEQGYHKLGWDNKTLFRTVIGCKNAEILAHEYDTLTLKAQKLGINLGTGEAFIVVVDNSTNIGKLYIADVNEVFIPADKNS